MNRNNNFSSIGQRNLDWLVGLLELRLQSKGKQKSIDKNGVSTYVDTSIYSRETLEAFIDLSLSEFNQTPYFTFFTLEDSSFVDVFADILVEGAVLYALSSQALIERGREFQIEDSGITIQPPSMAEMLNTQFSTLLSHHWDKLKVLKSSITTFKKQS